MCYVVHTLHSGTLKTGSSVQQKRVEILEMLRNSIFDTKLVSRGTTLEIGKTMFYRPHTIQANNYMHSMFKSTQWIALKVVLATSMYIWGLYTFTHSVVTIMQINTDWDCVPCVIMMLLCDITWSSIYMSRKGRWMGSPEGWNQHGYNMACCRNSLVSTGWASLFAKWA